MRGTGARGGLGRDGAGAAEAGMVTVLVVGLLVALVALGGLVVDGGLLLHARRRAINEAEAAALAGAQALAPAALRSGGRHLDPAAAQEAARRYLGATGHAATVVVAGEAVEVTVAFPQRLLVLGAAGLSPPIVNGRARVEAVRGVEAPEP